MRLSWWIIGIILFWVLGALFVWALVRVGSRGDRE